MTTPPPKRTEFVVSWPVQGLFWFRTPESQLILSDVYWLWIYDALLAARAEGRRLPFVDAVETGFNDSRNLAGTIPVTPEFLEALRQVAPSRAPSFELLVPPEGGVVPTPEQLLMELGRVAREALSSGSLEMGIG